MKAPGRGFLARYARYLLLIAATVATSGLFTAGLVRRFTYRQSLETLSESARLMQALITERPAEDLDALCKRLGTAAVRFTVIRADGTVLADSESDPAGMENHMDRPEFLAARQGRTGVAERWSASLDRRMLYVALPAFRRGEQTLVVRAAMPAKNLRSELGRLYGRIALAAAVLLAAAAVLALLVERRLSEPLAALQQAAAAFAAGDLNHYLRIRRPADLREAAKSLNRMAESLRHRIAEVTAQRNELQTVLAGMVEGVIVLDRNLAIRDINPSALRLSGAAREQVLGRSLLEVFRSIPLNDLAQAALSAAGPLEESLTLSGPRPITIQAHAAPLPENGVRVVLVLHDVTRLKALETVRKDFVANVSHELKTPLTAVKGALETLLEGALEDPVNARRFLEVAARHTERLAAIVDDLLSLSRLEQQEEAELVKQRFPLETAAREAVQVCQSKASAKGITLELEAEAELTVEADPRMLEQALTNLIDNAIKFSPQGSRVRITVGRRNGQAAVAVQDFGIGIPKKDQSRVFERFYRVDPARSRELGGTGLGLAIVKHIVLAHGGSIELESEPGAGSTFTILLPAC